jgi:hypothetical protein
MQANGKVEKVLSKSMNKYLNSRVEIVSIKVKIASKKAEYKDNLYLIPSLHPKALE